MSGRKRLARLGPSMLGVGLAVALAGCGAVLTGGIAGGVFSLAGGKKGGGNGVGARVDTASVPTTNVDPTIPVSFTLSHPAGQSAIVQLRFSTDVDDDASLPFPDRPLPDSNPAGLATAAAASAFSNGSTLATSSDGLAYTFTWNAANDLGARVYTNVVRLQILLDGQVAFTISQFSVDETALPIVVSAAPEASQLANGATVFADDQRPESFIGIALRLADADSAHVQVEARFATDTGPFSSTNVAAGELVDSSNSPVPLDDVPTSPTGIDYRFRFRSESSGIATAAPVSSVSVRFTATATKSSLPLATASFAVNNVPFSGLPQAPNGPESSGAIELRYLLFSSLTGGEQLDIDVEFSLASSPFLQAAAVPPPISDGLQGRQNLKATPAGSPHFFVWNAYVDLLATKSPPIAANPDVTLRLSVRRPSTGVRKGPFNVSSFAVDQRLIYTIFNERSAVVDGVDATAATPLSPTGLAVFTNQLYFADPFTSRVRSVDFGKAPPEIGTLFGGGFEFKEGSLAEDYFLLNPRGVAAQQPGGTSGSGATFVSGELPTFSANTTRQIQRIYRVDGATPLVTTLAQRNPIPASGGQEDVFGAIAYEERDDFVYFADTVLARPFPVLAPFTQIIRVRSQQFGAETVVAGQAGGGGSAAENVLATGAFLDQVRGIAMKYSLYPDLLFYTELNTGLGARVRVVNLAGTAQTFGTGAGMLTIGANRIVTLVGSGATGGPPTAPFNAPLNLPTGVMVDDFGDLIVAETGDHVLTKIDRNTRERTYIAGTRFTGGFFGDGLPPASALLTAPSNLTTDGMGGLFFTDTGNGRVRQIVRGPTDYTTVRTVAGTSPEVLDGRTGPVAVLRSPHAIVPIAGGWAIADTLNARVRRVDATTSLTSTLAGTGISKISGDGGSPANANVGAPVGLATGASGELFISQTADHVIRRVGGGVITTIAGIGTAGLTTDGAQANATALLTPRTLARTGSVLLFGQGGAPISTGMVSAVSLVPASGGSVSIGGRTVPPGAIVHLAGAGATVPTYGGTTALTTRLDSPTGICASSTGNIYVADATAHIILVIDPSGTITTLAGTRGLAGSSGNGGLASAALFTFPTGLCLSTDERALFVADQGNRVVRAINLDPASLIVVNGKAVDPLEVEIVAGGGAGFGPGDGNGATSATLAFENTIVGLQLFYDALGNLYIPDPANARIRVVDDAGNIRTIAGGGKFDGEDGPAAAASFSLPTALAVAPDGTYLVCDKGRIRRVRGSDTIVSTVAGTGFQQTLGDGGPALQASFDYANADNPFGSISDDANGIKQIALSGTFAAGTGIVHSLVALADPRAGTVHIINMGTGPQTIFSPLAPAGVSLLPGQTRQLYASVPSPVFRPEGVAFTASGLLLVSDTAQDRVLALNLTAIPGIACRGVTVASGADAVIYQCVGGENSPRSLAVDGLSTYLAIQADSGAVTSVVTVVSLAPTGGPNLTLYSQTLTPEGGASPRLELAFSQPGIRARGIAIDPVRGEVYYASPNYSHVGRFRSVNSIDIVAGGGLAGQGFSGDGGLATNAQLSVPLGVAFDASGSLYILDGLNFRIRRCRLFP